MFSRGAAIGVAEINTREPDTDHTGVGKSTMFIQIVGALAAITSTISLVPQIYKSHKTKSVSDLSILMLINFLLTSILWMVYGIMIASFAVTIANVIMTLFSLWMFFLYYKYSPKDQTNE